MKNPRSKIFTGLLLLSVACGNPTAQEGIDREAVKKEMAQREIKHVLPAEVVEAAYEQGKLLAEEAQEIVLSTYRKNADAVDFPQFARAKTSIDSLAAARNTEIHWIPAGTDTSANRLGAMERQVWDAYLYNVENQLPLDDNVQKIGDEHFLYTRPLTMSPELRKQLPGAEPTQENDFLGMWSIKLAKKEIIRDM